MKDDCSISSINREYCENAENQLRKCPVCLRKSSPQEECVYSVFDDKYSGLAEIRETGEASSYCSAPPVDISALLFEETMICDDPLLDGAVEFTLSDIIGSLSVTDLENLLKIQRSRKKYPG